MAEVTFTQAEIDGFPHGPQGEQGVPGPQGVPGSSAGARTVITNAPAYPADAQPVIQAGLNTADVNRGGDVRLVQGRYRIASGLASQIQGLVFIGEGMPGTDNVTARGSTQIVTADGITGISLGVQGSHQTRGYGLKRLHVFADGPVGNGTGVAIYGAEQSILEDIAISDYKAGIGLLIDGGVYLGGTQNVGGNAQYIEARNIHLSQCLIGLKIVGPVTGLRIAGGNFGNNNQSLNARSGTGLLLEGGDTLDVDGARFGGWDTCINLRKNAGHQVRGRFENFGTAVVVGAECRGVRIGGSFTRGQIGVHVEAGARNVLFEPTFLATDVGQPFVVDEPHPSVRMIY